MPWRRKEPEHQQPWYWPIQTELTGSPHVKGWKWMIAHQDILTFEWHLKQIHHETEHGKQTGLAGATWWRHQMETFFASLALCAGNSPVTGEFSLQRPVLRSFDFFYLRLNKRLSTNWDADDLRRNRGNNNVIVMGLWMSEQPCHTNCIASHITSIICSADCSG